MDSREKAELVMIHYTRGDDSAAKLAVALQDEVREAPCPSDEMTDDAWEALLAEVQAELDDIRGLSGALVETLTTLIAREKCENCSDALGLVLDEGCSKCHAGSEANPEHEPAKS